MTGMVNPIVWGILARVLHRKRRCPSCGREQFVPQNKRHEEVTCKHCGKPIPPAERDKR